MWLLTGLKSMPHLVRNFHLQNEGPGASIVKILQEKDVSKNCLYSGSDIFLFSTVLQMIRLFSDGTVKAFQNN